jgi:hypothetical protein
VLFHRPAGWFSLAVLFALLTLGLALTIFGEIAGLLTVLCILAGTVDAIRTRRA